MSIFCMLIISFAMAQVKTEKWPNGRIAKQYSLDKNGNYNGSYKEWTYGGKMIMQCNYLHGDLHGNYVEYLGNGTHGEESVYYKGVKTSHKKYRYFDAKRYLMYSATWDKDGILLTEGKREYSDYSGLGEWFDNAGLLPNGKGKWEAYGYGLIEDADYTEKYVGNDTIYVWYGKAKKQFRGKIIENNNGYKSYVLEYDKDGTLLKSPEKDLAEKREKARQDSIAEANKLAEKLRIEREINARKDTIANLKRDREIVSKKYNTTNSLYKDAINRYVIGKGEESLYKFLCNYLTKKKKKEKDVRLQQMIVDVLGIEMNVIPTKEIKLYTDGSIRITRDNGQQDTLLTSYKCNSINENVELGENRRGTFYIYSVDEIAEDIDKYTRQKGEYYLPKEFRNVLQTVYEKQVKLLDIMRYCNENKITIEGDKKSWFDSGTTSKGQYNIGSVFF